MSLGLFSLTLYFSASSSFRCVGFSLSLAFHFVCRIVTANECHHFIRMDFFPRTFSIPLLLLFFFYISAYSNIQFSRFCPKHFFPFFGHHYWFLNAIDGDIWSDFIWVFDGNVNFAIFKYSQIVPINVWWKWENPSVNSLDAISQLLFLEEKNCTHSNMSISAKILIIRTIS